MEVKIPAAKQMPMLKADQKLNHSVLKAFHLLEYFTRDKPEWGVRELAQALGANKSTTYRLLATLESAGVLQKNTDTDRYGLGLKLFELGHRVSIHHSFQQKTHPILMKVAEEITETVHLGILKAHQVFMVDKVESPRGLKLSSFIGTYSPLHCTSLGKILLAYLDRNEREQVLDSLTYENRTSFTHTTKASLSKELEEVNHRAYALDREELEIGLICVAVPVFNTKGELVAALSAAGPSQRFREDALDEYVETLEKGAKAIQQKIGGISFNRT